MLSIAAVSSADYYLRNGSGCGGKPKPGTGPAAYELDAIAAGEPPGVWHFPHRNDLGVEGEIVPGEASGEAFARVVNELRHPVTGEPLGKAAPNYASVDERVERFKHKNPEATVEQVNEYRIKTERVHREGRNAWDLTFSAQKSISVLHAALQREERHEEAAEVIAAFRAGIDAALRVVADRLTYTRRGVAGPKVHEVTTTRYVRTPDIQTAIFRHHVSRDRDPQLHAHVMLPNRVLCDDGQWRAIETTELLRSKHMLDAIFKRTMETEMTARLGTRWAARPDGVSREVVGIGEDLRELFSSRTRALTEKAAELIRQWAIRNGVHNEEDVPKLIKWRLQQEANRQTRREKAKDAPAREEDIQRWDEMVAAQFREGLWEALENVDDAATRPPPSPEYDADAVIAMALASLARKSSFNFSHLLDAIDKALPDMLDVPPAEVADLLVKLAEAARGGRQMVSLSAPALVPVPESLKDPLAGDLVFEAPVGGRYTTKAHLSREDYLVRLLDRRGAPALEEEAARRVLGERGLSDEQMAVAVAILTSDLSVQVVNAAAGTGKSRLMAALSDASQDMWGHGLVGLSASQNAAEVLAREGVHRAHNIAAFLTYCDREDRGEATDTDRIKFAVPEGATVVVDESSMVDTPRAGEVARRVLERGGRLIFIGDTEQVDAVDAGGGFALLTRKREPHTLTQVRRFKNEWERDASAKLRDGELEALTQYDARGRIRGEGEPADVEREAVKAFVDDHLLGNESVLVVGSGEKAAELSSQIRRRLVDAGQVTSDGVTLHDRTIAGAGDLIQTRMNNRALDVVNREVWRVESADVEAGTVTVRRSERDEHDQRVWGTPRTLPADYVRDHVELAYAATVQAVQGRTTDTGHLLVDDMMGRSRAYPGLTRGRERNTAWVPVERPSRRHKESDAEYEARIPSAMSQMVAAFEREDHTEAARTVIAAEQERATNLGHLGPQWAQLVAEHRATDHRVTLREVLGTDYAAVASDLSLDGLLHLMRSAESHGYDVRGELRAAYGTARLEGARSPASLLYAMFDRRLNRDDVRPRQQMERAESYAERTPAGDDPEITYARGVAEVMDQRVTVLGERAEVDPPAWAQALLGPVPADVVERGEWREKVAVVAGYREQYGWGSAVDPVGPAPSRAEPEKRWAWVRASSALGVDAERAVVSASDGDLANKVLAWRRANEWLPRNVDDDLREAHLAAGEARREVAQARTRGMDPAEAVRMLQEMEARIGRLEQVAAARFRGVEHTAGTRDKAQEALVEMQRRVDRDRLVAEREEARHAADDRDAREAADRDARVHAAVGERWRGQWVPGAPVFGSPRWAQLDDAEPAKRAGLFNAALQWWRAGSPLDEQALTDRLEQHGADVAPGHALTARGLERVRGGEDEERVRETEPSGQLEVLAEVHRYTAPDLERGAPEFGSPAYADADDEQKGKAESRAALRQFNAGDPLDERAARADALDERAGAAAISRDMAEQRHPFDERTHAEVVKAREEATKREPVEKAGPKVEKPEPARDEPTRDEPVGRAPEPVAEVKPPALERDEPGRKGKSAPEPKQVEQREPERVDTSWVREAKEAAERKPAPEPKRDDLAVQVARAQAAVERMQAGKVEAREVAPVQREPQAPVREDAGR